MDLQPKELVLCIAGHSTGRAKTIELHPPGVTQCIDRLFQLVRVEPLPHVHQGRQRGVEDLVRELPHVIVFADRKLAEARASRQALGQAQFQILKTGAADGTAKTHDRGFAGADFASQISHRRMHYVSRMAEHMVGDLEFGFAQLLATGGDVLEQVHVGFMRSGFVVV